MADWSSAVNAPGGISYAAPLMNFSNFSNWAADDPSKKIFDQQAQQINQQRITQGQQAIDLSKAFPQGLPKGPDGQIDYQAAAQIFARFGDPATAVNVMQQAPPPMSPLLGGGGGQPGGAAAPGPVGVAPASVQARPLPPPSGGSPRGDSPGSITDIVTDRLPSQNMTTGQTILKIADVMGVDPNATLTPGQLRRAQGLLQKYAPEIAGQSGGGGAPAPVATAGPVAPPVANGAPASFDSRFAAASGGPSGDLPPSANAGSPAPPVTVAPAAGGGPAQPQSGPAAPVQGAPQAAPAGPQAVPQPQGPIVPQVPLPKGFGPGQEQQAILALRQEAARLSAFPRAAGQVAELNNYAARIEQSIQPVETRPGETRRDPRTGQVIFREPTAKVLNPQQMALQHFLEEHPDATAEEIQKFNAAGRPARSAAAMSLQKFIEENPGATSEQIQDFNASQAAKSAAARTGAVREENLKLILKVTDAAIPAALEQSKKVWRTGMVPLNKLIQRGEVMTSDPELRSFGMANLQLAEGWARAMNPTGVMRESDREKALEFLSTADSQATYERLVKQLQTQINRELAAVQGGKGSKNIADPGKLTPEQKSTETTTPGGFSWSIVQ